MAVSRPGMTPPPPLSRPSSGEGRGITRRTRDHGEEEHKAAAPRGVRRRVRDAHRPAQQRAQHRLHHQRQRDYLHPGTREVAPLSALPAEGHHAYFGNAVEHHARIGRGKMGLLLWSLRGLARSATSTVE